MEIRCGGARRARVAGVLTALLLSVLGTGEALAAGPSLYADGLHISTGAVTDPAHRVWVSDHNAGFCRVTEPTSTGPGKIDHPQQAGGPGPRTCLGGLLPEAETGPDAAGAPAFLDPSPEFPGSGDEVVLIPDGASFSNVVWRAQWNPDSQLFETRDQIVMDADPQAPERGRPVAVAVASNGDAYVTFQRSSSIQRIVDAAGDSPSVDLIGRTSEDVGAPAVAAVYGPLGPYGPPTVVVAEPDLGLRTLPGTPTDPANPRITAATTDYRVPTADAASIGALAYRVIDPLAGTGTLFVGTANATTPGIAIDRVLRFDTPDAVPALEANQFSTVGGLGVRHDTGALLVLDDPTIVTPGEPLGTGRLFQVGQPYARFLTGPSNVAGQEALAPLTTATGRPRFTFEGDFTQECSVAPAAMPLESWTPCSNGLYQPEAPIGPDGPYIVGVRSVDPSGLRGQPDVLRFVLDRREPTATPEILSPAEGAYTSATPYLQFFPGARETEAGYQCDFSSTDPATGAVVSTGFQPCQEGRRTFAAGTHTIVIKAVDGAGNVGTAVSAPRTFTVGQDPDQGADPVVSTAPLPKPSSWSWYAGGLHIATGAFEAPDGGVWVADHNSGLCRVSNPTNESPGQIEHPGAFPPTVSAQSIVSRPKTDRIGNGTCLGGLLPEAREGADAAGQPAIVDPTPRKPGNGDEVALVPDGASKSSSLWRAEWNPATGRFDPLDEVVGWKPADDDPRPTAAAVGPDPDGPAGPRQPAVFYVTKRYDRVVRVTNPAGANPVAEVVGFTSDGEGAESIAVGERDLADGTKAPVVYLAEGAGMTRLIPSETAGPARAGFTARPVTVTGAAGVIPSMITFDRARGHLYLGTADATAAGQDRVLRVAVTNATATSATHTVVGEPIGRFTMVGGLGLRRDGRLLVTDDVALILPDEPLGTGQLYQVGIAAARVGAGPANRFVAEPQPTFALEGDAQRRCWVRPAVESQTPDWQLCGDSFTPASPLADGTYLLSVRSQEGPVAAGEIVDTTRRVPDTVRFTVDTQAPGVPQVTAVTPLTGEPATTSASPWFTFERSTADASSEKITWICELNGVVKDPCLPGRSFPLAGDGPKVADGANVLRIRARDAAGNVGEFSQPFTFNADAGYPQVTFVSPAEGSTAYGDPVFVFRASEPGVTFGCRVDGLPFKVCDGVTQADGSMKLTTTGLKNGEHTFQVHARDPQGNMGPTVTRKVVVDRRPPPVIIDSPAAGAKTSGSTTATWHVDPQLAVPGETYTFVCRVDTVLQADCDGSVDLTGLTDGSHTLTVRARDAAGVLGPVVSRTWTVDATGPVVEYIAPSPGHGATVTTAPEMHWTSDEPATFKCRLSTGTTVLQPLSDCTSPQKMPPLGVVAEPYRFIVEATDAVGNESRTARTYVPALDVTSPVATLSSPSAINANAQGQMTLPVDLAWTGQGMVSRYEVTRSADAGATWQTVNVTDPLATTLTNRVPMGTAAAQPAYRYRVRACTADVPAVCSGWTGGARFTVHPIDNAAPVAFSGAWTGGALAGAFGGTTHSATAAGPVATLPGTAVTFTTRGSLALVGAVGPDRGRARVTVDNGTPEVVDFYAANAVPGRLVFTANDLAPNVQHTIKVEALGTRRTASTGTRIDVDAFVALR